SSLKRDALLINGRDDHQIPEESWKKLHRMVPDPKTVKIIQAGHMHPENKELTLELIRMSHEWLLERNAVNP
ncbi:MAG: hypothetical protein JXL67_04525, partial [Calditrichaeota bacterium]|nr:hypothetical protein [Calditrichota bacterium]